MGSFFSKLKGRIKESIYGYQLDKIAKTHLMDSCIQQPSYRCMDAFIDIERLKSLDNSLTQFIKAYIKNEKNNEDKFTTGPVTLKAWQKKTANARLIPLTAHIGKYDYLDLDKPEFWKLTDYAEQLPELMAFIRTLPFKHTARIMLIFDTGGSIVTAHRDHILNHICHEFIWFRTNFKKPFYVYHSKKKKYITGYSAWFDTVNQFHGADASDELNFSIRVDGIFNDKLRALIPKPSINPASTPSYWEAMSRDQG